MVQQAERGFPFKINDVILAKYEGEIYYAKILSIYHSRKMARVLFDDNSKDEVEFENIFNVNETTSDIICVVCKEDKAEADNDIVLCDRCNVGYHQQCHCPVISSEVLLPEVPWECRFCIKNDQNPYIQCNPFNEMLLEDSMNKVKPIRLKISTKKEGYQVHIKDDYVANKDFPSSPINKHDNTDSKCKSRTEDVTCHIKSQQDNKAERNNSNIVSNKSIPGEKQLAKKSTDEFDIASNYTQDEDDKVFLSDSKHAIAEIAAENPAKDESDIQKTRYHQHQQQDNQTHHLTQCRHSDVFHNQHFLDNSHSSSNVTSKLKEQYKTNPIIDQNSNNNNNNNIKHHNTKDNRTSNKNENLKKKKYTKTSLSNEISDSCFNSRYEKDLPRHNWLVERLKRENKIDATEIEQLEQEIKTKDDTEKTDEKEHKSKKLKENQNTSKRADGYRKSTDEMRSNNKNNINRTKLSESVFEKVHNQKADPVEIIAANDDELPSEHGAQNNNTRPPPQKVPPLNITQLASQPVVNEKQSNDRIELNNLSNPPPNENNINKDSQEFNFTILKVESLSKSMTTPTESEPMLSTSGENVLMLNTVDSLPTVFPRVTETVNAQVENHDESPPSPTLLTPPPLLSSTETVTPTRPTISASITIFQPKILQNNNSITTTATNGILKAQDAQENVKISAMTKSTSCVTSQESRPIPQLELHPSKPFLNKFGDDRNDHKSSDIPCDRSNVIPQLPVQMHTSSIQHLILQRRQERIKAIQMHRAMLQTQQMKLKQLKNRIETENRSRSLRNEMLLQKSIIPTDIATSVDQSRKQLPESLSINDLKRIEIEKQLDMQKQWIEEHDTQKQLEDQLKKKTDHQIHNNFPGKREEKEIYNTYSLNSSRTQQAPALTQHRYLQEQQQRPQQEKQQQQQKQLQHHQQVQKHHHHHQQQQQQQQQQQHQQPQHHQQQMHQHQQIQSQQMQHQLQKQEHHQNIQHQYGERNLTSIPLKSPPQRSKYEELLYIKRMERAEMARRNGIPISPQESASNQQFRNKESYVGRENLYQKQLDAEYYSRRKISPEMENRLMYQLQKKHDEGMSDSLEYESKLKSMNPRASGNRGSHEVERFQISHPINTGFKEYMPLGSKRRSTDQINFQPSTKIPRENIPYVSPTKVPPCYPSDRLPQIGPDSSKVYNRPVQRVENFQRIENLQARRQEAIDTRTTYIDLSAKSCVSSSTCEMVHGPMKKSPIREQIVRMERISRSDQERRPRLDLERIPRQDLERLPQQDLERIPQSDINLSNQNNRCKICGQPSQFLCSGCRSAWYCSQECQHSDWRRHLHHCKR